MIALTNFFYLKVLEQTNFTSCLKITVKATDSVDPYHSAVSVLGLQCFLRRVCPKTQGKYNKSLSVHDIM